MFIYHQPCWVTYIIYDIPDEEFLQNLICMLSRPNFIWIIMIGALVTPLVVRFIKFYGPCILHPEGIFDDVTIAYILSINLWCWDFMLSVFVTYGST